MEFLVTRNEYKYCPHTSKETGDVIFVKICSMYTYQDYVLCPDRCAEGMKELYTEIMMSLTGKDGRNVI